MYPEEDTNDDVSFYESEYESEDEDEYDLERIQTKDAPWRRSLKQCLDDLTAAGQIASFKQYPEFANPGLRIEHHPEISLPLNEKDAEAIKSVCCQAPFGHDDETGVDNTVRNTWEWDHTQYNLKNPHWGKFFQKILDDIGYELGIGKVAAKPYKMLLYGPGSLSKSHKDTEKETGMVGTLVICLPSKHEGSNVNVSLGSEKHTLQTAPTSAYDLTALAWYSDVPHEVEELTSGYRLVLTYKLFQIEGEQLSAEKIFSQSEKLGSLLSKWHLSTLSSGKLAYGLDHQYTQSSLSLKNLKGRDQAVCHALHNLCSKAGLYVFLARVERSTFGVYDDEDYGGYYEDEDPNEEAPVTELEAVYSLDGELIATHLSVDDDDVLGISYKDRDPDSTQGEYTEHGMTPTTRRWHDAAIVLLRKSDMRLFLKPSRRFAIDQSADPKAVAMVKIAARDLEKHIGDPSATEEAVSFISAALGCGVVHHIESASILTTWGLILGNVSLLVPVLNASLQFECRDGVSQIIAEMLQMRFDKDKDGVDWNKWYVLFLLSVTSSMLVWLNLD